MADHNRIVWSHEANHYAGLGQLPILNWDGLAENAMKCNAKSR